MVVYKDRWVTDRMRLEGENDVGREATFFRICNQNGNLELERFSSGEILPLDPELY